MMRGVLFFILILIYASTQTELGDAANIAKLIAEAAASQPTVVHLDRWYYDSGYCRMGLVDIIQQIESPTASVVAQDTLTKELQKPTGAAWRALQGDRISWMDNLDQNGIPATDFVYGSFFNGSRTTANKLVDIFGSAILKYPRRVKGRMANNAYGRFGKGSWDVPACPKDNPYCIVWGDDAFMGTALLITGGIATNNTSWIEKAAEVLLLMSGVLVDSSDSIFWHGYDTATHQHSCCKWGRANGWISMAMTDCIKVLPKTSKNRKELLLRWTKWVHGMQKLQSGDGRWHQVLTDNTTFLETSGTSFALYAMITGVMEGWVSKNDFDATIKQGYQGLLSVIGPNGEVSDICNGFGIHNSSKEYNLCPRTYGGSMPGLGAVFRAAAAMVRYLKTDP